MVFDTGNYVVVPAPLKKILNIGWAHRKYFNSSAKVRKELLRGKAMSLMAESRGSPVLQSLAMSLMRLTAGGRYRIEDDWSRAKLKGTCMEPIPVSYETRQIMEDVYQVNVVQQMALEEYFDSLTSVGPLIHPFLLELSNSDQIHYFDNYVRVFEGEYPDFCLPPGNLLLKPIFQVSK